MLIWLYSRNRFLLVRSERFIMLYFHLCDFSNCSRSNTSMLRKWFHWLFSRYIFHVFRFWFRKILSENFIFVWFFKWWSFKILHLLHKPFYKLWTSFRFCRMNIRRSNLFIIAWIISSFWFISFRILYKCIIHKGSYSYMTSYSVKWLWLVLL